MNTKCHSHITILKTGEIVPLCWEIPNSEFKILEDFYEKWKYQDMRNKIKQFVELDGLSMKLFLYYFRLVQLYRVDLDKLNILSRLIHKVKLRYQIYRKDRVCADS